MLQAFLFSILITLVPCSAPVFSQYTTNLNETVAAFGAETGQPSLKESADSVLQEAPRCPDAIPVAKSDGSGKFLLRYIPAEKKRNQKWEQLLRKSKLFDETIDALNQQLVLPSDLIIETRDCGEDNAWYDSDEQKITFCYELLANTSRVLRVYAKLSAPSTKALFDAEWTIYHELGHALIDLYHLPATGREEDAADQLATLTLLADGQGDAKVLTAALGFWFVGKELKEAKHPVFWDEHSLSHQRYYDIMCLVYGKDPKKYAGFVTERLLPAERAENCAFEYQHYNRSWGTLLAPYLKESPTKAAAGS